MNIWRLILAIFLGFDFYFHAFRYFQYDKSAFSITSYSFMATNFVALAILLLWETQSIFKITKLMGDRLKEEVKLLKLMMWCFSLSYAFIAVFYFYELILGVPCKNMIDCSEFTNIMILIAIALLFDWIPNAALYYCHYRVTKNNYEQISKKSLIRKN